VIACNVLADRGQISLAPRPPIPDVGLRHPPFVAAAPPVVDVRTLTWGIRRGGCIQPVTYTPYRRMRDAQSALVSD
jgi:hypothetical protein